QLRDPRRARDPPGSDCRGASLEHRGARGVAATHRDLRPDGAPCDRQGARGLSRSARVPCSAGMNAGPTTRIDRLSASLDDRLLVTNLVNVRYLTAFEASNAALPAPPEG